MGYRFDLQSANWLASLLEPRPRPPLISDPKRLLNALEGQRFLSSPEYEYQYELMVRSLVHLSRAIPEREKFNVDDYDFSTWWADWYYWTLRMRRRNWTACIIPSGTNFELDNFLCSHALLRELVDFNPEHLGLILQPDSPPSQQFSLVDVFPAFQVAIDNSHRWPGLLVWSETTSTFLALEPEQQKAHEQLIWITKTLYAGATIDELRVDYHDKYPESISGIERACHIVHLSDVHIGSREASLRLERALRLVRDLRAEYGPRIIPIVSGDLFDTPDRTYIDGVMRFLRDLESATGERPFCVVGNHDVRAGGFMAQDAQPFIELQVFEPFRTYPKYGVGLLGMNSCDQGELGRGEISETQYYSRADLLKTNPNYMWFGVVHHHPVPVSHPDWEYQSFLQRWLGGLHAPTVDMVNGDSLLKFCSRNGVGAILHGHKHIPRFTERDGIKIIGCGSTVGKINTKDGNPYLSINVLSLFPEDNRIITRLLAERAPGSGLDEQARHEFVHLG